MKIIIYGKNIELTDSIKIYVNDKVGSTAKMLSDKDDKLAEARVEVGLPSKHHKSGEVFYAEINLSIGSKLFRANEKHIDLHSAIVQSVDELKRQLRKERDKELSKRRP
ncbi:MAG: ribosomal subunit interface protein [Candidatus Yanofskybacteria bacterium CG10_big_fil_rev_8_21_14_0_10_36_16]|uniref:Ribosomal subunit interface protein n=1 Tax=Candidatus Yanofskybacteria bacterium CG10_big_fil_rev_8_21_14_0_10_36_16 TaxID=1975096 RepID=A0A2J0Q8M0_9BACT|nr:MAG: ribosomal subunit interface protein [Candidatus Yanofskybacteria bacterium CG10_big_fil_rev_8_21_14_0_10_36_16]